jgi:uncharacterized membrane protein
LEGLITLAVLLIIGLPIVSIAALALSVGARSRLDAIDIRLDALEAMGRERIAEPPLDARPHAREGTLSPAGGPGADDVAAATTAAAELPPPPPPPASRAELPGVPPPAAEGVPDPPPPPPTSVPTVLPPAPVRLGLEEQFGTRWVVWAGGLALALGGIFLVRYSIERGWVGPAVRIILGALLSAALIGAGERLRRREKATGVAGLPSAHIPSILTAAGTTVGYATVFAAYAIYGFIGPATAFVLLGAVALATLGAALLHGPALAALGLVGAEVAPLLVATETPNYWVLYVYIAVVTAAAFALARLRLWLWLTVTALAFGLFWAAPGIPPAALHSAPFVFHAMAGFGLAALLIVAGLFLGPESSPGRIDAVSSGAVTVYLLLAAWVVLVANFELAVLVPFALLVAATVAVAWRTDAAAAALPAGALLSTLIMFVWGVLPELSHLVAPGPGSDPSQANIVVHFTFGALFAGLFGVAGYRAQGRSPSQAVALIWSTMAVLTPIAILIALYARIYELERSLLFAAVAVALAAWFATAAEWLLRREPQPGVPAAAALHAAGSAAALALALTFSLEKGWLTVGLALMAPGIAWVEAKRPLPLLRWIAAVMAGLVVARIAVEPRIVGDDLGTTPFFNWLLYGYGVPALAFWSAGFLLRRRADDEPSRMLDAAAILFTVLFVVLEIRHYMTGGDIYAAHGGLAEQALHVCALLAMAIGLEWLRQRTGNVVHDIGARVIAAAALVLVITVVFGADNPRMSGAPVGGVFLNLILLGYGLPAGLATTLALIARGSRPMAYRIGAAAVSVMLALAYLTLEIMRLYHGPELTGAIGDAESYTFSAIWLAFGVVLLIIALPLDSKPTRLASAAVVGIATVKVFVFDLAGLAGVWRPVSFIGLGLVLIGIGYLYQHLLFPAQPARVQQGS